MTTQIDPLPELTVELTEGLPLEELEQQLFHAFRGGDIFHRMRAFYLVELDQRRLYQKAGCANVLQYAEQKFGVQRRTARELLAVGRELLELPLVDQAFRDGSINWSKTRLLVRICIPETQEAWLEKAREQGITEFAQEVSLSEKGKPPREDRKGLPKVTFRIHARVGVEGHELWEAVLSKFADESGERRTEGEALQMLCQMYLSTREDGSVEGRKPVDESIYTLVVDVNRSGEATLRTDGGSVPLEQTIFDRIACDAAVRNGAMAGQDPQARASTGTRARILRRDGYRCQSCDGRHGLQVHHIQFFSDGGPTTAGNLTVLCNHCHSLVHEKLLIVKGNAPHELVIENACGEALHEMAEVGTSRIRLGPLPQNGAAAPLKEYVEFEDLPEEMDRDTWERYSHLIQQDKRTGRFKFVPGYVERAP